MDKPVKPRAVWFWGGFLAVLLVALAFALFAVLRSAQQWAEHSLDQAPALPQPLQAAIAVTLGGGEPLLIAPDALPLIRGEMAGWLETRQAQAAARLETVLRDDAAGILTDLERQVPAFADWYYSLKGSYLRLFHAAAGDLPEYLAGELEERLFTPAGTAEAVDRLSARLDKALVDELNGAASDLAGRLRELLERHRVEASGARLQVEGDWHPLAGLSDRLAPFVEISAADVAREGAATSAGAAASAVVFKKLGASTVAKSSALIAGKQSAGMLAALAAKLGLSTAAKGGAALTGAGTGAAVCAGTGVGAPLAPACALLGGAVAGAATWVLTDKAVLEADEWMNRETFEQELREALAEQNAEMQKNLEDAYVTTLGDGFGQLRAALTQSRQPAPPEAAE